MGGGGPGVYGGSSVPLPGVVVADVVDEDVLVWLGGEDVPVVGVVQEGVAVVLQLCRGPLHLDSNLRVSGWARGVSIASKGSTIRARLS